MRGGGRSPDWRMSCVPSCPRFPAAFVSGYHLSCHLIGILPMSAPASVRTESALQQCSTSATDPDKLLTTDEAAAYLRVSPRTMEDWRRTGSGPLYISLARNCVRYRFGDLTHWISRRRVRHTLQPTA